ncbi:MAG TPA: pantoate--beta-alanine ligase [Pirellulales bacterium]|nr:pantoate--beta-alanine ligase [Pirellulales bacterium]
MSTQRASSTPRAIASFAELRRQVGQARRAGKVIGLVPTMGALHAGHLSLVEAARRECGFTVVTVFVNPLQFGPDEDFASYPRTLETDLALLAGPGADLVFAPSTESMFASRHATYVDPGGVANCWEGQHRPGHFRGVATIVLKLFNLAQPDRAYFGRKDYQQSLVVRRMVEDLDLPIEVEVCPTVRDADGLALSSRNRYLSADERRRALSISSSLRVARQCVERGTTDASIIIARIEEMLQAVDLTIDYVAIADPETLESVAEVRGPAIAMIAARVGKTRLIDNAPIG